MTYSNQVNRANSRFRALMAAQLSAVAGESRDADDDAVDAVKLEQAKNVSPSPQL
jgi:hypothetical protein